MSNIQIQQCNGSSYTNLVPKESINADTLDGYHASNFLVNDSGLSYNFLNGYVTQIREYNNNSPFKSEQSTTGLSVGYQNSQAYIGNLNSLQIKGVIGENYRKVSFIMTQSISSGETINITVNQECLFCPAEYMSLNGSTVESSISSSVYKINTPRQYTVKFNGSYEFGLVSGGNFNFQQIDDNGYIVKTDIFKQKLTIGRFYTDTLYCQRSESIIDNLLK